MFGDKCGSFSDGVGQFVGIEKSPCIDQCPPAIDAGKILDQWASKGLNWMTPKSAYGTLQRSREHFLPKKTAKNGEKGQK